MDHVYVNPQTQQVIAQLSDIGVEDSVDQTIESVRAAASQIFHILGPPARPMHEEKFIHIPGPGGELRCKVWIPVESDEPLPVLLYFMGGTYTHTHAEELGGTPSVLAEQTGAIMVIPEHRMPPENPFPAAFDDCFFAYQWLLENAGEIGGDPNLIAIGGGSSAGTIAAAVCQDAKAAGLPQPVLQWLDVPLLDQLSETESMHQMKYLVGYDDIKSGIPIYFGEGNDPHPRASPLRTRDLTGLAPAYITTCDLDPLRDEGKAYATRLRKAGVPCTYVNFEGQIHGLTGMGGVIEEGMTAVFMGAGVIRRAFEAAREAAAAE